MFFLTERFCGTVSRSAARSSWRTENAANLTCRFVSRGAQQRHRIAVERLHTEVTVRETVTPYSEKRMKETRRYGGGKRMESGVDGGTA